MQGKGLLWLSKCLKTKFQVTIYELRYGLTNCSWSSCREGCTAEFFKCHQIRVTYTPKRAFQNDTKAVDIEENEWAYLKRTEKPVRKRLFLLNQKNVLLFRMTLRQVNPLKSLSMWWMTPLCLSISRGVAIHQLLFVICMQRNMTIIAR